MKENLKVTSLENEMIKLENKKSNEVVRAVEELRTAIIVAKREPRNELKAETNINEACSRIAFAKTAFYSYQIQGKPITGKSIHFARMVARYWGNIHHGLSELERYEKYTEAEAFCWDLESNTKISVKFHVLHERSVNVWTNDIKTKTKKVIEDSKEVSDLIANMGARKVRNCIIHSIPAHIIDRAAEIAMKTIEHGEGMPIKDRISIMLKIFNINYQVSQEMLEKYLGHKAEAISAIQLVQLQGVINALRDGYKKREDYFKLIDENSEKKIEELNSLKSKLAGPK